MKTNAWFDRPQVQDGSASLVVCVVALPLSLGIALACDTPIEAGLVAAVIGGIVAGLLSGAPLVASGPAAGLIAMVLQLKIQLGFQGLLLATAAAGFFQMFFAAVRAGQWFLKVPTSVLEGMLGAIGLIILLGQVHALLGAVVPRGVAASLEALPISWAQGFGTPVFWVGLISVAIQVLWPKIFPRLQKVPGALPAVLFGTLGSLFFEMPRVEVAPFLDFVSQQSSSLLPIALQASSWTSAILGAGASLALVASAESLLTARAVAGLAETAGVPMKLSLNRELVAQGAANLASGLLGGLPVTGVIVRSAANVNAGARTQWATVFHGVWLGLFVVLGTAVLKAIPIAALASVLVVTGVRLLNLKGFLKEWHHSRAQAAVWAITFGSIVATQLLKGLGIGLAVAVLVAAWNRRNRPTR